MIQAINGLQAWSRRSFPAWKRVLPLVLELLFPPLEQLPGVPGESVSWATLVRQMSVLQLLQVMQQMETCVLLQCLGAAVQTSCCGEGQATPRAGRTDDGLHCSSGVGLYLSVKNPPLTSETKHIVSCNHFWKVSPQTYILLCYFLWTSHCFPVSHVKETFSVYISR